MKDFIVNLILTAFIYLLVPFMFCLNSKGTGRQYEHSTIKKIVIINAICGWILFRIIEIEMTGTSSAGIAVFLWSWIAYKLLKKHELIDDPYEYVEEVPYEYEYIENEPPVKYGNLPYQETMYDSNNHHPKNAAPVHYGASETETNKAAADDNAEKRRKQIIIFVFLAAIVFIMILFNFILDSDANLTPMKEPKSGEILSGSAYRNGSEITVSASGGEDCVVKLKNQSGITRICFYVQAGDTVTVGVPMEYLYVYFASGDTWYGYEHLFGEDTDYSMDKNICNFVDYTWEYTMYPVSNGNFSQTPIDEDDF